MVGTLVVAGIAALSVKYGKNNYKKLENMPNPGPVIASAGSTLTQLLIGDNNEAASPYDSDVEQTGFDYMTESDAI